MLVSTLDVCPFLHDDMGPEVVAFAVLVDDLSLLLSFCNSDSSRLRARDHLPAAPDDVHLAIGETRDFLVSLANRADAWSIIRELLLILCLQRVSKSMVL